MVCDRRKRWLICRRICAVIVMTVLFITLVPMKENAVNAEETMDVKRVLFISSYSYSWETVPRQINGIQDALGNGYVLNYEFMDTKNTNYSERYAEFYQLLKFKLAERIPYDAVIVGDDAAFNFAMMYKDELFTNIPIVFEGVDNVENGLDARANNSNVTGIVEQVDYKKNLKIAMKMIPDANKIYFILDDAENGIGIQAQLEKEKDLLSKYDVEYINSSDYSQKEMCKLISQMDSKCICFYLSMSQSKNNMIYTEEERFEMLRENSKIPMFRVSSSGVENCEVLVGGYVISHYDCGIIAGNMVKEAITEQDMATIPVVTETPSEYYFDCASLEKYGISKRVIPQEATLVHVSPTFVQKYYTQIIVVAVTLGIILMLILLIYYFLNARRISIINERLDSKNKELEKVSEYKSKFLSNMSHEIRTPMNGILGMTSLALDNVTDEVAQDYLQEIDETSKYMLSLLNDVLDMSRIDSGRFELNQEWVNSTGTMWSCIRMIEPSMNTKNIRFVHPNINNKSKMEMYVDSQRVKQVVMNLLNNAFKFTPEGGTVSLEIKNLEYDEHRAVDLLTIRDTGCGMSEEFLKNGIFKPFSQEQNVFSNAIQGTGLGLALVKQIVEKMGGTIQVESELGKGTTFNVTIPYEYRMGNEQNGVEQSNNTKECRLNGKRILVVEDHPLNSKIAVALLEKEGATVVTAENGQIAVDIFCSNPTAWFDVVLMDVRMPVMNGYDATRTIRALEREDAKTIPIIAMTANAFAEDIQEGKEAGMTDHLSKPIDVENMIDTILQYI